jgi:hypothetical protein
MEANGGMLRIDGVAALADPSQHMMTSHAADLGRPSTGSVAVREQCSAADIANTSNN